MKFKVTIENGVYKLEIDINILLFDEFNDIVKADKKDRNRKRAKQLLLYVYLSQELSSSNPIYKMEYDDKMLEANRIAFGTTEGGKLTKKEQQMMNEAINAYVRYSATPEERLLANIDKQIDELNKILGNTQAMKEIVKDGQTVIAFDENYSGDLTNILKAVKELSLRKTEITNLVKHNSGGKIRGGSSSSLLEGGKFRHLKSKTGK